MVWKTGDFSFLISRLVPYSIILRFVLERIYDFIGKDWKSEFGARQVLLFRVLSLLLECRADAVDAPCWIPLCLRGWLSGIGALFETPNTHY